jgi:hypothetical protein
MNKWDELKYKVKNKVEQLQKKHEDKIEKVDKVTSKCTFD